MTRTQLAHDAPHVAHRRRAEVRDHPVQRRRDFGVVQLPGQELLDHRDLGLLALGKLDAAAFLEGTGGFLSLLDHLREERDQILLTQAVRALVPRLAAGRDLAVLDARADQAQRGEPGGVARLHRLFRGGGDAFAQIHGSGPFDGVVRPCNPAAGRAGQAPPRRALTGRVPAPSFPADLPER